MANADENKEFAAEPKATEGERRVILLAGGGPLVAPLALALAARGDSIILSESGAAMEGGGPEAVDAGGGDSTLPMPALDLQLAIERAGGISLRVREGELGVAAESFGRIDAAVALTLEAGRQILLAAAPLERRLRPARLIIPQAGAATEKRDLLPMALNADTAHEMLGAEIPPGMRVYAAIMPSGPDAEAPAEFLTRILAL